MHFGKCVPNFSFVVRAHGGFSGTHFSMCKENIYTTFANSAYYTPRVYVCVTLVKLYA